MENEQEIHGGEKSHCVAGVRVIICVLEPYTPGDYLLDYIPFVTG
jgi:hypothetical protein